MALLIKAEDLKGLISIPEAIAAVRDGYRDQGERPAYSAPRIRIQHEDRRVSVHPGGCHRLQVAGTFVHVERFTFRDGAQQYERAGKRVYVAYDSETAELKTIIVGSLPLFDEPPEDWFGTETPITGAVGTDILARLDCRILGLYGTGRQARRHLVAMCTIRPSIEQVRIFSRSADNRAAFVARMQPQMRPRLVPVDAPEAAARGADLICLATGSNVPVLFGAWLEPGQHITSIVASNKGVLQQGSVSKPRREFDDAVIARADRVVATLKEQAIVDEQADLFEPVERGVTSWDKIADLGELVTGKATGRQSAAEITVFKQNSDQGVGFMALAKLAYDKAKARGLGIEI
ncbi:MAG TPA: ornithine cyclodeaminase family protein [Beijerinckiaceae bacterium]|nr:ornithine cyclodeaminase family protein [Beijerinckiaceae bacterium]